MLGKRNIILPFLPVILICVFLSGCTDPRQAVSEDRALFAMDTYMTLTAYGPHAAEALDAAEEEIRSLDQLLSTGNPESEITHLNKEGNAHLSDVSAYLFQRSLEVNSMTEGAFNPLVYPLMNAWGFTDQEYQVPDEHTISELLPLLDLDEVQFDEGTKDISFGMPGMMIDFGGIAKGYTSSRIMAIFEDHGVAGGLVSLGGNVQVIGNKPDGSRYKIAIQDPEDHSAFIGIVETDDKAVITSGGYERFFEEDGITYHHILDPKTGYPAVTDLLSVTVVSSDGTLADGLSTALFVLGKEKGAEVWKSHPDQFDVVFLTKDHELYVTEGIRKDFQSSEYPIHPVSVDQ